MIKLQYVKIFLKYIQAYLLTMSFICILIRLCCYSNAIYDIIIVSQANVCYCFL